MPSTLNFYDLIIPFSNSMKSGSPLINLNYPHLISNLAYIKY